MKRLFTRLCGVVGTSMHCPRPEGEARHDASIAGTVRHPHAGAGCVRRTGAASPPKQRISGKIDLMRNSDPFSDLIRSIEENLERSGGGGWVPPEGGLPPRPVPQPGQMRWMLWLLVPLVLFIVFNFLLGFLADYTWFSSLDLGFILLTRVGAALALFTVGALFTWLFIAINIWIARRLDPFGLVGTPPEQIGAAFGVSIPALLLLGGNALAFLMGLGLAGDWQALLLYLNQTSFGVTEPVFGQDVGFFIFTLPVWEIARSWLIAVVAAGAGGSGAGGRCRLAGLASALARAGATCGAGRPVAAADGLGLSHRCLRFALQPERSGLRRRLHRRQCTAAGIQLVDHRDPGGRRVADRYCGDAARDACHWRGGGGLGGHHFSGRDQIYPAFVQRFQVDPDRLTLEHPYIASNIDYTSTRLGWTDRRKISYTKDREVTPATLLTAPDTIRNIRLSGLSPFAGDL